MRVQINQQCHPGYATEVQPTMPARMRVQSSPTPHPGYAINLQLRQHLCFAPQCSSLLVLITWIVMGAEGWITTGLPRGIFCAICRLYSRLLSTR